jgi:hypothetical protein
MCRLGVVWYSRSMSIAMSTIAHSSYLCPSKCCFCFLKFSIVKVHGLQHIVVRPSSRLLHNLTESQQITFGVVIRPSRPVQGQGSAYLLSQLAYPLNNAFALVCTVFYKQCLRPKLQAWVTVFLDDVKSG